MKTHDSYSIDARQILLTGDISKVFLDADVVRELPCKVCTNVLDAIDAAAKYSFRAIGVVMSGAPAKLGSALKTLREANSGAKIILLAKMYQEPTAMHLVDSGYNGPGMADEYLICPIRFSHFITRISSGRDTPGTSPDMPAQRQRAVETTQPTDVDDERAMRIRQLEELATTDELTGLKNRRYIWEFFRQIIERASGTNGQVTLLIFDLDNFKHYNDVYGHLAGDEILRQAAVLIQCCCRGHDVVGRIGGDEFAVVFWDDPQLKNTGRQSERRSAMAEHPREAIFIAKRFRRELEKTELHLLGPEGEGALTISGGLASFPRDGSSIEQLFEQADKALLEAKSSGKNRIYLVGTSKSDINDIE